jgi:hypothetical protein
MFEEEPEAVWPLEVEWEILDLARPGIAPRRGRVVTKAGRVTRLTESISHARGQDTFALQVSARNHARHQTELEYELRVSRAEWETLSLDGYFKHRLGVGPAPTLGEAATRASRADIVAGADLVAEQEVEIDGIPYLVRIRARSLAG